MPDSPAVTPIPVRDEDLATGPLQRRRAGRGDRAGRRDECRADDGVDERSDPADEPGAGAHRVLVPVAFGGLAQGRHLRRPAVHPQRVRTTATATRCCSGSSRRATAPATPAPTRASSATSAHEPRRRHGQPRPRDVPATRQGTPRGARLADAAGRSHHPGCCVRAALRRRRDRLAGLPPGIGRPRRTLEPLVLRRPLTAGRSSSPATAPCRSPATSPVSWSPRTACWPLWKPCWSATGPRWQRTSAIPASRCRRCTPASSAISATTWSARSSTCPTPRPMIVAGPTR